MQPHQPDRRRPLLVRTDVLLKAKLFREGAPDLDVRLRNLSPAGFMAECLTPIETGTEVILSVPGVGSLPAQIRWNVDTRIGGIFHFELGSRELGLIRASAEPQAAGDAAEDAASAR
jgi:hypothetical protein